MHDPWMDRLSEYIDGELAPTAAQELEQHLAVCDACSRVLEELRTLVDAAGGLEDEAPAADLWPGIAAGIAAAGRSARVDEPGVLRLHPREAGARRGRRGYSFSAPQLAAAAVLLMTFSAAGAWWLTARQAEPGTAMGTIVHTAGAPSPSGRLVDSGDANDIAAPIITDESAAADIAELERTLNVTRAQLDPSTVDVIERSLESIDQAIATAHAALEADPGNPHLARQLDNAMRKKLDLLRRAHRVQRAGI